MRITEKDLAAVCERINRVTGNPPRAYEKGDDGTYKAQIGNYHISHAYGGVSLHQMQNEGGGIREVFSSGHIPKKDLYHRMHAFLAGIETCN